jgi:hypothetical protein
MVTPKTDSVGVSHSNDGRNTARLILKCALRSIDFLALVLLLFFSAGACNDAEAVEQERAVTGDGIGSWQKLWPGYVPNAATTYLYDALDPYYRDHLSETSRQRVVSASTYCIFLAPISQGRQLASFSSKLPGAKQVRGVDCASANKKAREKYYASGAGRSDARDDEATC